MTNKIEMATPGEYAKQVVREAGSSLYAIAENVAVLTLCVFSPVIYLVCSAYCAWKSRK
jgi:hypothetical protein